MTSIYLLGLSHVSPLPSTVRIYAHAISDDISVLTDLACLVLDHKHLENTLLASLTKLTDGANSTGSIESGDFLTSNLLTIFF